MLFDSVFLYSMLLDTRVPTQCVLVQHVTGNSYLTVCYLTHNVFLHGVLFCTAFLHSMLVDTVFLHSVLGTQCVL